MELFPDWRSSRGRRMSRADTGAYRRAPVIAREAGSAMIAITGVVLVRTVLLLHVEVHYASEQDPVQRHGSTVNSSPT